MVQEKKSNKKQTVNPKKKSGKSTSTGKDKYFIWLFVIVLISFFAFLPVLQNGFVNLDDDKYILNNPLLFSFNLKEIFSRYVESNYHPLTMLTYAIEYQLFGLNAQGYHVVNLLLHLLNVILVFYVVLLLSNKIIVALVAAMLFGIHPLHVESVAWASELKNLLYVFFFLAAYVCYLRYLNESKRKLYWWCLIFFLLSLFSKAMAVSLPLVLLLTDYFKGRNLTAKVWLDKAPFFLFSIIFGVIAILAQKSSNAIQDLDFFPFQERIAFAGYGFITYLFKLFVPLHLSAYYPYPVKGGTGIPGWYYIYPFVLLSLMACVFYSLRFSRKIFFSIGFFAITVFLVLQLLPVGNTIMADRYSYLPSLGIFYLAGEGFYWLWMKKNSTFNLKTPAVILLGGVVLFFSVKTYQRCAVWENSLTLWDDVISKYQTIPVAYNNRGVVLETGNKINEALTDYNKAIELDPGYALVYYNRGTLLSKQKKYIDAINDFNKAIELKPEYFEAYNNRGTLFLNMERWEEALADYDKAIKLKPDLRESYYNLAISEYNLERKDDACHSLQKAMSLGMQKANDLYNQLCK